MRSKGKTRREYDVDVTWFSAAHVPSTRTFLISYIGNGCRSFSGVAKWL